MALVEPRRTAARGIRLDESVTDLLDEFSAECTPDYVPNFLQKKLQGPAGPSGRGTA